MFRSDRYLARVRSRPCCFCYLPGPSDPHHYRGPKGMAIKPSDAFTVPLCRLHHDEFHRSGKLGDMTRAQTMGMFDGVAVFLLAAYVEEIER